MGPLKLNFRSSFQSLTSNNPLVSNETLDAEDELQIEIFRGAAARRSVGA